jgi:hypothetical protein
VAPSTITSGRSSVILLPVVDYVLRPEDDRCSVRPPLVAAPGNRNHLVAGLVDEGAVLDVVPRCATVKSKTVRS